MSEDGECVYCGKKNAKKVHYDCVCESCLKKAPTRKEWEEMKMTLIDILKSGLEFEKVKNLKIGNKGTLLSNMTIRFEKNGKIFHFGFELR